MSQKKCQLKPGQNNCAHQLSLAFGNMYPNLMNGDGKHFCSSNGFMRCGCGAAIRARQVRNWAASKGYKVNKTENNGTFIIFEYNNIQAGGHVWGYHNGAKYGNGYYNGYPGDFKNQEIYKI